MTQLERYGSVMDKAVPPLDVEAMRLDDQRAPRSLAAVSTRLSPRPLAVMTAAFAVVLLTGLILWTASQSGGGAGPADQSIPTTTPSVSFAPPEIDPAVGVPYEPVTPFRATIELHESPGGDFVTSRTPLLQVSHGGVVVDESGTRRLVGLRIDVVRDASSEPTEFDVPEAEDIQPPAFPPARGSFVIVTDGAGATYYADRDLFVNWLDGPHDAGELTWRNWSEYCALGSMAVLGTEMIADRETTHVRCDRTSGTTEVWIDTESGMILRSEGNTASRSRLFGANLGAHPASFTIVDLSFETDAVALGFGAPAGATEIEGSLQLRRVLAANPDTSLEEAIESIGEEPESPLVGAPAPQLRGTTPSGTEFDLAEHRGQRVVVLWWSSWCPPALDALDVVQAASETRDDLVFVAAAFQDQPEGIRDAVGAGGIKVDVIDASQVQQDWGVVECPTTFLIDSDGTVGAVLERYHTLEELLEQL